MVVRELITKLGFNVDQSGAKKYENVLKTLRDDAVNGMKLIGRTYRIISTVTKFLWAKAIKDNFEYASSLTEVEDSLRRTFNELYDDIDKWSREAGKQFGLSELQAKRYNMSMGAILKTAGIASPQYAEMSKRLVGLSADLASFYNIDNDSAMHKIRSAMSGYTIGLRQLGINMSDVDIQDYLMTQGIKKSYYQMTDAEKYIARYNFLLSRTTMIQGDFNNALEGSLYNYKRLLASKWQNIAEKVFHGATPQAINFAREIRYIFTLIENKVGAMELKLGLFWGKLARRLANLWIDVENFFYALKRETNNFEGTRKLIDAIGKALKKAFGGLGELFTEHADAIDRFLGKLGDILNWITENPELAFVLFGIGKIGKPLFGGILKGITTGWGMRIAGAAASGGATAGAVGAGAGMLGWLVPVIISVLLVMGLYELYKNVANFKPWADPDTVQEETDKANTNYWYNRQKAEKEKEEWSKNGGALGELWDRIKDTPFGKTSKALLEDLEKTIFGEGGASEFGNNFMKAMMGGGKSGNDYIQRTLGYKSTQNNSIVNNITLTTTGLEDAKLQGVAFGESLGKELANQIHNVGFKIPNND